MSTMTNEENKNTTLSLNMNNDTLNKIWLISVVVTAVTSFFLAGSKLFDFDLPGTLTRILGLLDLAAIPALVWSTLKKTKQSEEDGEPKA